MKDRIALALERLFVRLAHWFAYRRERRGGRGRSRPRGLQKLPLPYDSVLFRRELTEDEIVKIAEAALTAELNTELRAPHLKVYASVPRHGAPTQPPIRNLACLEIPAAQQTAHRGPLPPGYSHHALPDYMPEQRRAEVHSREPVALRPTNTADWD